MFYVPCIIYKLDPTVRVDWASKGSSYEASYNVGFRWHSTVVTSQIMGLISPSWVQFRIMGLIPSHGPESVSSVWFRIMCLIPSRGPWLWIMQSSWVWFLVRPDSDSLLSSRLVTDLLLHFPTNQLMWCPSQQLLWLSSNYNSSTSVRSEKSS